MATAAQTTGLELDPEYFQLAEKAIPRLAALYSQFKGQEIEVELNGNVERNEPEAQLAFVLAEGPLEYGGARAARVVQATKKTRK